jgi:hypothetical protein
MLQQTKKAIFLQQSLIEKDKVSYIEPAEWTDLLFMHTLLVIFYLC